MAKHHRWGSRSKARLSECHPAFEAWADEVLRRMPFDLSITVGHRGKESQNEKFDKGLSRLRWPRSRHNTTPSLAIHLVPWVNGKIDYEDEAKWLKMGAVGLQVAIDHGLKMTWGGNWDSFARPGSLIGDGAHFELDASTYAEEVYWPGENS